MKKYLNVLTISLAMFLLSGCLSNSPKPEEKIKKEAIEKGKQEVKDELKSKINMPPESNLIDKLEEEVIIEDTPEETEVQIEAETPATNITVTQEPQRQLIESVD